jgi:hypothetical protein
MNDWLKEGSKAPEEPPSIEPRQRAPKTPTTVPIPAAMLSTHTSGTDKFWTSVKIGAIPECWNMVVNHNKSVSFTCSSKMAEIIVNGPGVPPSVEICGNLCELPAGAIGTTIHNSLSVSGKDARTELNYMMEHMEFCCGKQWYEYPPQLSAGEPLDLGGGREYKIYCAGNRPMAIRNDCMHFKMMAKKKKKEGSCPFVCSQCKKIKNTVSVNVNPSKFTPDTYLTKLQVSKKAKKASKRVQYVKGQLANLRDMIKEKGVVLEDEPKGMLDIMRQTVENVNLLFEGKELEQVKEIIIDQIKTNSKATKEGMSARWLPGTIRLGLALGQGSKAYGQLRKALKLPGKRTLDNYVDWVNTDDGFHEEILMQMSKHVFKSTDNPKAAATGMLCHDGMSLKKGLIISKAGKLEGVVEKATDTSDIIQQVQLEVAQAAGTAEMQLELAEHYFVMYWASLGSDIAFPIGHWRISTESAAFVTSVVEGALRVCAGHGLDTVAVCCDGAEWNRIGQKQTSVLSLKDLGLDAENDLKCAFPHPSHGRPVFHLSDCKHLTKKWRNSLFQSGKIVKDSEGVRKGIITKTLSVPLASGGHRTAVWDHLERAHDYMNQRCEFRYTRKVGHDHIHLSSRSKMRVYLAEGVMSAEVAEMIEAWVVSEDPNAPPPAEIEFTVQYIRWGASVVEFYTKKASFRGKGVGKGENDARLESLASVVREVGEWREALKAGDGNLPEGQTFSQTFIPDHKLWYDLRLYQASITGVIKMLLRNGHPFVSVCRLHSDYCEVGTRGMRMPLPHCCH